MRALLLALAMLVVPSAAFAGTDIVAVCYKYCEAQTHSNPEYKACLARAADKADAALNQAYKVMQDKIRAGAKEMDQPADPISRTSRPRRNTGSISATPTARSRTISPSAERRWVAITRHASALSLMSASPISSAWLRT
jgi:hypothetical protein